jgi:hypothetical protein
MRRYVLVASALAFAASCSRAPVFVPEVVVAQAATLPSDPADPAWNALPVHRAPLLLQDLVEPRLMTPSTAEVRVRAASDGTRIAFRLEWDDASKEDLPGPARFTDACAVQLPARIEPDVPAPQMGELGKPVEITHWRATWQAVVDGRADDIHALYPGAATPHYPFDAESLKAGSPEQIEMAARYAPARNLGNAMAGPRTKPVEDLVAEGPGSLHPAPRAVSDGKGSRLPAGWAVVLSRPLPTGLAPGGRTEVAFAIWQGNAGEVGARKMRSAWTPMKLGARP